MNKWRDDLNAKVEDLRAVRAVRNDDIQVGDEVEVFGIRDSRGWEKAILRNKVPFPAGKNLFFGGKR